MMRAYIRKPGHVSQVAVGLVGPGQIGKTLLKQLAKQESYLRTRLGVDLKLVGISNSKKMLVASQGVGLDAWESEFDASSMPTDFAQFTDALSPKERDAVIFDCTASDAPASQYNSWMSQGIHIITPNKKLHSGPIQQFEEVKNRQAEGSAHYFYEATCGAGLPVLNTLKGLVESGDEVLSIQGIFSGTLSFIFNTWQASQPFSSVVLDAKEKGFTEPDPRDDLSGMDVARKVIILARECGSKATLESLQVDSLVPESLRDTDVATFLEELPKHDKAMQAQLESAQAQGQVLRYVGSYDAVRDKCAVTLQQFPADHPFGMLDGTDNIVQIQTARYKEQPLIVRGPGAGTEVTAAGCFADFLQLVRYLGARS